MAFSRFCRVLLIAGLPVLFATSTIVSMAEAVAAKPTIKRPARKRRYIPRKRRRAPRRTEAGGTRGCSVTTQSANIQLLVPRQVVGHTNSARPTFSWYVDNPKGVELPMQFAVVEPGVLKPVYQTQLKTQKSGVMQVTLPQTVKGLEPDKAYRWMVSWSCDLKRPSEQLHRRAWIERSAIDNSVDSSIVAAQTVAEKITVYGQSGLWYEAIDIAAQKRRDAAVAPLWQQLLEDGQLPAIK